MTEYHETAPDARLAPWVQCLWELSIRPSSCPSLALERVLPDGCVEWVFHLGAPFRIVRDGVLERQARALLVGATRRAVLLEPARGADVLGVRFRPGGAHAFVRHPIGEWTDRVVGLDVLGDRRLDELAERLHDAPRGGRQRVLERELLARVPGRPWRLGRAVAALQTGRASVDCVGAALGIGARQLQRRFVAEVGLGPKELARIGRFQRAARLVSQGGAPLCDIAYGTGYADQAHFVREFRAFAGTTPGRYRAELHALADAFVGV